MRDILVVDDFSHVIFQNAFKQYFEELGIKVNDWEQRAFHLFPILCEDRDELQKYLEENGVGTNIHYPIPPHQQECYRRSGELVYEGELPVTCMIHRQELSLPLSQVMTDKEVDRVIAAVNSFK